ncbi:ATP-binding protein [Halobacillus sp. Marseille-Q1614]|uniref:ATP-binding protein n=1 Tax=Halobacillus sp. Marseille-Q1614 TaxID=2709134 RepID=UPI0020C4515B|nr:ATP-binding protein [Halobacillus sp. Marseille-Q1614]
MIKERYSDHVYSDEMLYILGVSGTPACLLDVHHQTVTLNNVLKNELLLDESNLHMSRWLSLFQMLERGEIYRMIHHSSEWSEKELSVSVKTADITKRYYCKMLHLSNDNIAFIFSSQYKKPYLPVFKHKHKENYDQINPLPHGTVLHQTEVLATHPKAIRTSQVKERLVQASDYFPHGIAMLNRNWEIIYANTTMEKMVNLQISQYYRKKLWDLFPIDDYYDFFQHYLRAMETQETVNFIGEVYNPHILMGVTVVPSEQGITIIAQDVTSSTQQLRDLEEVRERFTLLSENIKEACWICYPQENRLLYISQAFNDIYGLDKEEVMKEPSLIFSLIDDEFLPEVHEAAKLMMEQNHEVEFSITTPAGDKKWVRMRGFPIKENGQTFVIGMDEDITKFKEMTELQEKSQQLSTITQMAAGVAHEIKNPLTAIKGFLQIGAANPDLRDSYHDIILDEVNRIESIVQDFMMLSKPKSSVQLETVNLESIITYVSRLLDPDSANKNIKLYHTCDPELSPFYSEPKRLKQILINLLSNAIDALGEKGEVQVEALLNANELVLSIIDNGHGLSDYELTKLGEPFYTTKEKGTGLGIMVTKKMIDDLDGKILYESTVGEGTRVTVRLPYKTEG